MVVVSSNFSEPAEGVLLQTPSTKLLVNDQELGSATLYITENNVVWGGGVSTSGGSAPTISLLYPSISLHAIQREPSPALFMVLNYELRLPELTAQPGTGDSNEDDDDEFDAEDQPITQLRFVPADEHELQALYAALCQGQALHPDPTDELDDEPYMDGEEFDEGDEEFEDAESALVPGAGAGVGVGAGAGAAGGAEEAAARMRDLRLHKPNGAHHCDEDSEDAEIGDE